MAAAVVEGVGMVAAWDRRFPPGSHREWGRALQPKHVQRTIMAAVAAQPRDSAPHALAPAGPRPPRDPVPGGRAAVRSWVDTEEFWRVVAELAGIADQRAVAVGAHFRSLVPRPPVTAAQISEWACSRVAEHYRRSGGPPSAAHLDAEQAAFQHRTEQRGRRVRDLPDAAGFVERHRSDYEEMCAERGPAARRELRPEELGLGRLPLPPMAQAHNGWRAGTDHCVRARYSYVLRSAWDADPDAVALRTGKQRAGHLDTRLVSMTPEEVGTGVLHRATAPLGLRLRAHQVLVAAFVGGVREADLDGAYTLAGSRPRGTLLTDWAAEDRALPAEHDGRLETAVSVLAEWWAHRGRYAHVTVTGLALAAGDWPDQVRRGTARKLWHTVHNREVLWEQPVTRDEVAELVPVVFTENLRELVRRPLPVDDLDATRSVDPGDPRIARTQEVLWAHPDGPRLVALIAAGDPAWRSLYGTMTAGRGCLPVELFATWLRDNGTGGVV